MTTELKKEISGLSTASIVWRRQNKFRPKLSGMIPTTRKRNSKKKWKALVVWDSDDTRLSDISRYFNRGNKTKAYQASWVRNCMTSRAVWEHYGKPARERENAKDKTPSGQARWFGSTNPNSYCVASKFISLG